MSEQGIKLLEKMHSMAEYSVDRKTDITIAASRIKGYPYSNADLLTAFHAYLKLAANTGAIKIEWKKHFENHELKRLRLLDAKKLAEYLGVDRLHDVLVITQETLNHINTPEWFYPYIEEILDKWRHGKTGYRIKPADTESIVSIAQAVTAIESFHQHDVMDYRQFGARYLGNSKRLKDIAGMLSAIYRQYFSLMDLSDKDVLSYLNLVPLSHPVFISGPVTLGDDTHSIDVEVSPYLGVPYTLLESIQLNRQPDYILTIENLSSFNEYTQSINDNAVIVYTAGYPTSRLQNFYQRLVEKSKDAPLYHWGDADPHGFQILKTLQQCAPGQIVHPHLMHENCDQKFTEKEIVFIEQLMPVNNPLDLILNEIISSGRGKYEQEILKAMSPVLHS